jgi:two-component system cell cycle response regulator
MPKDPMDSTVVGTRPDPGEMRQRKNHASLVVLQGVEIGRDFRLKRNTLSLGRDTEADIRIADELASRQHASIEFSWDADRQAAAYHLVDLRSTNHTYVNSRPIERIELKDGDRIQIGSTLLKFVLLDDVEAKFHAEVRSRISYDQLTRLLTKESLYLALDMELKRSLRYKLPVAILMMDLDHFKRVNDSHGHPVGSEMLSGVGQIIRETLRGQDVAARYGGEEFVAYLAETPSRAAHQAAERLRARIAGHTFSIDGHEIRITISIGIALCPEHGLDIATLVASADKALYRAKKTGRDRVCLADAPAAALR